jgi:hypothetical protein
LRHWRPVSHRGHGFPQARRLQSGRLVAILGKLHRGEHGSAGRHLQ